MNSTLFICLLFLFAFINCIAQVNPWEPTGGNPWTYAKGENPWAAYQKNHTLILNTIAITDSISNQPNKTAIDSINQIVHNVLNAESDSTGKSSFQYTNQEIKQLAKSDYPANASFIGSMISCSIFNVFAIPVNLISSTVPVKSVKKTMQDFDSKYPGATQEQRKLYKSTIQTKRAGKAMGGSAVGIGINILLISILIM